MVGRTRYMPEKRKQNDPYCLAGHFIPWKKNHGVLRLWAAAITATCPGRTSIGDGKT
jgi:hypothetical protein